MLQSAFPNRPDSRRTAGFTLAELLIVVAIILVLVAIAVPVFTGAQQSSEEATCAANRRSVKSAFAAAYMLDTSQDKNALFAQCLDNLKASSKGDLCPAHGEYTAKFDPEGNVTVQCSVHGLSLDDTMYSWIQDTYKDSWDKYWGTDHIVWDAFMTKMGWTEWPEVKSTDGKPVYLKFKGFTNNPKNAFLYAGQFSDPNKDDWNSRYICDSAGKYGEPGQWYELPKVTGLTGIKNDDDFKNLLATGKKVNLVNGEFKSA